MSIQHGQFWRTTRPIFGLREFRVIGLGPQGVAVEWENGGTGIVSYVAFGTLCKEVPA